MLPADCDSRHPVLLTFGMIVSSLFLFFPLEKIGYGAIVYDTSIVVGVAQLVERLTVAQNVAGSSPVSHPIFLPSFEVEKSRF